MKFKPRLAHRLILSITLLLVLVASLSSYYSVTTHERELVDLMISGADQLSRSITSATWHAMLANHRTAIHEIIEAIALKQGIDRIRIFNKQGKVMFATRTEDSMQVSKSAAVCSICHDGGNPRVEVDPSSRVRIFGTSEQGRQLAIVTPIYNEPSCSGAACHAHPASQKVLGVLDLMLDMREIDRELAGVRTRVFWTTGLEILLMAGIVVIITRRLIEKPIRQLIGETRAVSEMKLETPVHLNATGELGELAQSFDKMRVQLKENFNEINEFTQNLEEKVAERTEQLRATNQKLMQADRLTSLGQLAASVAHEINNPLSGVLNLSMLLQRILRDDGIPPERIGEFKKYLAQITNETGRVGRIVSDLLAFSRRSKPQRSMADINAIIRSSCELLSHGMKLADASVDMDLQDNLPMVLCDSSQIQQVVINLLMNSSDAVQGREGAKITVKTRSTGVNIRVEVSDNGEGIRTENLSKIFDPFFTTKAEGKGVGLGLAVAFGIVDSHGGDIDVISDPGHVTTFTVTLPIQTNNLQVPEGPPEGSDGKSTPV